MRWLVAGLVLGAGMCLADDHVDGLPDPYRMLGYGRAPQVIVVPQGQAPALPAPSAGSWGTPGAVVPNQPNGPGGTVCHGVVVHGRWQSVCW